MMHILIQCNDKYYWQVLAKKYIEHSINYV